MQTRARAVLLELGKTTPENGGTLYEALKRVIVGDSSVTEMIPKTTVEIRNCDCWTTI